MSVEPDFTPKNFGANLRKHRKARGYTQEGFAHVSGIDRSYLGGIERGDRNPALEMIIRLAEALEIPPTALFEPIAGERRERKSAAKRA